MKTVRVLVVLTFVLLGMFVTEGVRAADGTLAMTPPMGWNSWNKFGCNVSEELIKSMADAIASGGMRDAGYRYVVIDDC